MNIEELVAQYNQLTAARENIDQQLDWIKGEFRRLGAGRHTAGQYTVSVTPNRRIDEARVTSLYPVQSHPELYTAKPDVKKMRAELPDKVVDSLMAEVGEPRVSVK